MKFSFTLLRLVGTNRSAPPATFRAHHIGRSCGHERWLAAGVGVPTDRNRQVVRGDTNHG